MDGKNESKFKWLPDFEEFKNLYNDKILLEAMSGDHSEEINQKNVRMKEILEAGIKNETSVLNDSSYGEDSWQKASARTYLNYYQNELKDIDSEISKYTKTPTPTATPTATETPTLEPTTVPATGPDKIVFRTTPDQIESLKAVRTDAGSVDDGDVGPGGKASVDYSTEYTQKYAQFYNGDGTVKEGDMIAHTYHRTRPDDITTSSGEQISYLPGQIVKLADDPTSTKGFSDVTQFTDKIDQNSINEFYGTDYKLPSSGQEWSKVDYMAAMSSSGQYSGQDLWITINNMDVDWADYDGPLFAGTELDSFLNDNEGEKYKDYADALAADVSDLTSKWQEIDSLLDGMSGNAIDMAQFDVLQDIKGMYKAAMGNISDRLDPVCVMLQQLLVDSSVSLGSVETEYGFKAPKLDSELSSLLTESKGKGLLSQLKEGEKKVNELEGKGKNGSTPTPNANLDYYFKEWEKASKAVGRCQELVAGCKAREVEYSEWEETVTVDGKKTKVTKNNKDDVDTWTSEYNSLQSNLAEKQKECDDAKKAYDECKEKYTRFKKSLGELHLYVMALYNQIKNYDQYRKTYRRYLDTSDSSGFASMIYATDAGALVSNHANIVQAFEDYKDMPVISNFSDYEVGDVLYYDTNEGGIAACTGKWDPLTGGLKIAFFDKNGNRLSEDITVWDQREIVPINGVRKITTGYTNEYADVPDKFNLTQTETPTKSETKPTYTPTYTPTTPPTTTTPTTTPTYTPTTPTYTPTATPTYTPTATTTPTTTPTSTPTSTPTEEPATIPPIPIYTIPETTTPGGGSSPYSPHTGLDAIYGTGDTKQSAAGLGALAGLAAGAAGLGLTGLIGDKKDDEEEDEKEKEKESIPQEIEKKEINNQEVEKQETTTTDNNSNPMFF